MHIFTTKNDFIKTKESLIALGLSTKNQNALLNAGVTCLGDLLKLSENDLMQMHNLGEKGTYQIKDALKETNIDQLMDLVNRANQSKRYISKRQKKILDMWNSGAHTYQSIGDLFGVSRERIRQILNKIKRKGYEVISVKEASMSRRENFLNERRNDIDEDVFVKMFNQGFSREEICAYFSFSEGVYQDHKNHLIDKKVISNKARILNLIKSDIENVDELTKHREQTIMKMRKKNYKLDDIALELEISKIRLTQIIKRMKDKGYDIPNSRISGGSLSHEEVISRVNQIEHCLDNNMSIRQISHVINVSPHQIKSLAYKYLIQSS
tara:strand:- start:276 stop:1247 length:972 start_codon:yes stop_codon:yes gene_type:complete